VIGADPPGARRHLLEGAVFIFDQLNTRSIRHQGRPSNLTGPPLDTVTWIASRFSKSPGVAAVGRRATWRPINYVTTAPHTAPSKLKLSTSFDVRSGDIERDMARAAARLISVLDYRFDISIRNNVGFPSTDSLFKPPTSPVSQYRQSTAT